MPPKRWLTGGSGRNPIACTPRRDARQKAMSGAERLAHRRELAQPWVEEIRETCRTLSKEALPKSALGKAVAYMLNQWPKLVRCLEYEEVELSNNLAENSMLPVALGRKNRYTWAV